MKTLLRILPLVLLLVAIPFMLSGCSASQSEGFAIYLTREDVPPTQLPVLSRIKLADTPLVAMGDVVRYNSQTHELKLTDAAFERITSLPVPVTGTSFVVCVDRKPIYAGAFWTPISSLSFDGVTIWKPLGNQQPSVVTLELGYPSPSFYGGEDPRNNPEILKALERAGKLVERISINEVDRLPKSMKGYELYSWSERGEWQFRLITGTNRNKTLEEIVSAVDFISESGWVSVRISGEDALKAVLGKLRQGEEIFWLSGPRAVQADSIEFMLPPAPIVDSIKALANAQGLALTVQPSA